MVSLVIFYLFLAYGAKSIQVLSPIGGEELEVGKTYEIQWKAKGLEKVGIVLFKGAKAVWLAKDVKANLGKYEWKIYPGQEYGPDYWLAVFEYPWQKGNAIDYSDKPFAITFSELAGCEGLAIEQEWPYLPSDYPGLRRVFVTDEDFSGNLDGLEGADKKCQAEAEKQGFSGNWQAFIGGDSDKETALTRLNETERRTGGIFIQALPSLTLERGATCHRLLAKGFEEFLTRLPENIWLGRLDEKSKKNCIAIAELLPKGYVTLAEKYSFTATCQNWTQEKKVVEGYPVSKGEPEPLFPTCYTPEGKFTNAVALAGLASGMAGKSCDVKQKLLCIEK